MHSIKKIVIVNGFNYCGGRVVLSELCRSLNRQGYKAYLLLLHSYPTNKQQLKNFSRLNLLLNNLKLFITIGLNKIFPFLHFDKIFFREYFLARHLKGCKIQILPFFSKKSVIVYPEVIYGNPLKAKNVVRWLLYYNRYPNDSFAYGKKDLFICYRAVFNDIRLNPNFKTVTISSFDNELYKRTNYGIRTGSCYIIRKGKQRSDLPSNFDGVIIDTMSEEEKVKVFNECEYCYSYDTQTFYSVIAALCGCKSIVILEPGKEKNDYLKSDDTQPYGVAYGTSTEEINWAVRTQKELSKHLNFDEANKKNTNKFIEYILDYFFTKQKK